MPASTMLRETQKRTVAVVSQITVEPILLVAYIALYSTTSIVMQNMLQDFICRTVYNGTVSQCDDYVVFFAHRPHIIEGIQTMTSDYNMYAICISTLPAVALFVFVGPWSDRHGRKYVIMMPLAGGMITCILFVSMLLLDFNEPQYVLIAIAPLGLTGGKIMMLIGCLSYIGDWTGEKERTARMAIVDAMVYLGLPLGTITGGQLYGAYGYTTVYAVAGTLFALTLLYSAVRITNKSPMADVAIDELPATGKIFNLATVLENFKTCLKKRDEHWREFILILLACDILVGFSIYGEQDVLYLYARKRYNWNIGYYSYYQTFYISAGCFAMAVVLPILSHGLKLEDSMIGILANSGSLLQGILKVFSYTGTIQWIAGSVGVISGITYVMNRAMMSKCVPKHELGKLFAVDGILIGAAPTYTGVIYTRVYNLTMTTFPGAVFILSAATALMAAICFGYIYYLEKRKPEATHSNQLHVIAT